MSARTGGFTLIEIAVAMVLLAVGLLALTGALARGLHATASARSKHAALRDAAAVADSLAAAPAFGAGARVGAGVPLWWEPASCDGAACIRVSVVVDGDTLRLLTARAAEP